MKKITLALSMLFVFSAFADSTVTVPTPSALLTCSFVESLSVSFGYRSIYAFNGTISVLDAQAQDPFYEVSGPINVAISKSASTNRPAEPVGQGTANMNNHPWGTRVMLDIASTGDSGDTAFRILVFPGTVESSGAFSAYKMDTLTGNGFSGICTSVDPRLITTN